MSVNSMKKSNKIRGAWIDIIYNGVGEFVRVETSTGVVRTERLTGLRTRVVKLNGIEELIPVELEMNGDPTDLVPFAELVKIDIN
jgi:hypothetical protein